MKERKGQHRANQVKSALTLQLRYTEYTSRPGLGDVQPLIQFGVKQDHKNWAQSVLIYMVIAQAKTQHAILQAICISYEQQLLMWSRSDTALQVSEINDTHNITKRGACLSFSSPHNNQNKCSNNWKPALSGTHGVGHHLQGDCEAFVHLLQFICQMLH